MDNPIRQNILDRARDVFSKYGFRKTTMEDIAGAVGKGKSSLYYYFKNKEEIFEGVLEQEVEKLKNDFRDAIDSVDTPKKKLSIYILKRMEMFHQLIDFFPSFRHEFVEYYSYIEKIRVKYDNEELMIICGILQQGIDEGQFVNQNLELTAQAIIKAMKGFEFPWAMNQDVATMERDIDSLLEVLFYGIVKR
jgi:AcrR family transcriptional regulator